MLRPFWRSVLCAAIGAVVWLAPAAHAQERLPGQYRSFVFLDVVASRGLECGLLRPWQSAALEAQVADGARGWSEAHRVQLASDAATQAAATACEDEAMNAWIEGAQRGIESEMLSHFIVAYAAMSQMSPPPTLFSELTQAPSHEVARAAIAAKLAELEASGAAPEGGGTWTEFTARTGAAVQEMARAYDAGQTSPRVSREQAEAWIAASVRVTELWLAD